MTVRMCKCEVRELLANEEVCPACAEEETAFWRSLFVGACSVAMLLVGVVASRGGSDKA